MMFTSSLLAEFWKLWATLALSGAVSVGAIMFAVFVAKTDRMRHVAIDVAAIAAAVTFVFAWGAHSRDALANAQIAQMERNFSKFLLKKNTETAEEVDRTVREQSDREAYYETELSALRARISDNRCVPNPGQLEQLRNLQRGASSDRKRKGQS